MHVARLARLGGDRAPRRSRHLEGAPQGAGGDTAQPTPCQPRRWRQEGQERERRRTVRAAGPSLGTFGWVPLVLLAVCCGALCGMAAGADASVGRRPRDLLPLPMPHFDAPPRADLSHAVRRRVLRRQFWQSWMADGLHVLNGLGHEGQVPPAIPDLPSLAQSIAADHVAQRYMEVASEPHDEFDGTGALGALCAHAATYADAASHCIAYDPIAGVVAGLGREGRGPLHPARPRRHQLVRFLADSLATSPFRQGAG